MPVFTIELPASLESRVAAIAERAGMTTQEFIVLVLAEKLADENPRRIEFHDTAERRYDDEMLGSAALLEVPPGVDPLHEGCMRTASALARVVVPLRAMKALSDIKVRMT